MPTMATSEIRKPARDTDPQGHWQVEPQTSHPRFGARTLAGLVETSGRFRSISGGARRRRGTGGGCPDD
jgi:hypothetical protein